MELKKLTESEAEYVDAMVANIITALIQQNQIQLNAISLKTATASAYDMALAMLEVRRGVMEVEPNPQWGVVYYDATQDVAEVQEAQEVQEVKEEEKKEKKEKKPKKKKVRKPKEEKPEKPEKPKKSKGRSKKPVENEYNIKPLLEAATEVMGDGVPE